MKVVGAKPCPFCGSALAQYFVGSPDNQCVGCGACAAEGPVAECGSESDAVKLWNTRPRESE